MLTDAERKRYKSTLNRLTLRYGKGKLAQAKADAFHEFWAWYSMNHYGADKDAIRKECEG